eukprot:14567230-Alexandrium_andersonii.AAC.1
MQRRRQEEHAGCSEEVRPEEQAHKWQHAARRAEEGHELHTCHTLAAICGKAANFATLRCSTLMCTTEEADGCNCTHRCSAAKADDWHE